MLPKNKLVYGSNVESSAARSYRSNIQPQNGTGTYYAGDTITINIPTRNNLVLVPEESVLKFTVTYKNGTDTTQVIRFDSAGGHSIFDRIRVWHGSNLLEDITSYGVLAKLMFDLQVPSDATYGKHSITTGTRNDLVVRIPTLVAADFSTIKFTDFGLPVNQINSGARISGDGTSFASGATCSTTLVLNLISLIGSLGASRYFPLFACTSAPLRVEITLASNPLATVCALKALDTTTPMTITNCEYIGQFIELNDTAMSIISNSQQGQPIQYVFQDYRNYQYSTTLGQSSTTVTMPIPAKFASLKSLFVCARENANISTLTYFPLSCNKFKIASYFFRIGATVLPSKVPDSVNEMFIEVCKAIASISDLNHHPSIEYVSYSQDNSVANATDSGKVSGDVSIATGTAFMGTSSVNSGSFYVGLDLENYANSDKSQIFAGWNSSTDDIYYIPTFAAQTNATVVRFDSFALYDSLLYNI
jgi:hypothetical protein